MATREEVIELIRAADLKRVQHDLEGVIGDAVRVATVPVDDPMELGASRIGGAPDLPVQERWPERADKPMAFLAQFRLRDVASFETRNVLPSRGMMYFFHDAEEQPWGTRAIAEGGECCTGKRTAFPWNDVTHRQICPTRLASHFARFVSREKQLCPRTSLILSKTSGWTRIWKRTLNSSES